MSVNNRPDRTTMEGMIWNANHVLEQALRPGVAGIPKNLFEKCVGIVLFSVVEAGFTFSGSLGTGILLAKKKKMDEAGMEIGGYDWSLPVACGFTGVGWGFLVGASVKDLLVFVFDDITLDAVCGDNGLKLGGQAEITLGPFGRTAQLDVELSNKGLGSTLCIAYSKGAFLGLSVEGAVLGTRNAVNDLFYHQAGLTPMDIIKNKEGELAFPKDKVTLMDKVYEKLEILAQGNTVAVTPPEEEQLKEEAKKAADQASKDFNHPDIVEVNAEEEAKKEAAAAAAK